MNKASCGILTAPFEIVDGSVTLTFGPQRGDRVRIRKGYDGAGEVYYYRAKDANCADQVVVDGSEYDSDEYPLALLAAAIELYPYSRDERAERAIEDLHALVGHDGCAGFDTEMHAALHAILDAGV